jgi:hypothetical protein
MKRSIFSRSDLPMLCFAMCMAILFFIFMVLWTTNPDGIQLSLFFRDLNDFFADFFNLLHDISEKEIYSRYGGSYFPLPYMILYPFSKLDNFSSMTLEEMWVSKLGLVAVFLFTLFSIIVFFLSLNCLRKKYRLPSYILTGLFLSGVFFYSMERGNLIFFSVAGVCFFLCYYDSSDRKERIFAVIALSFAATLKIYPAIYGLLYLERKQYKEIFLCVISVMLLVFLPFVFFKGGFSNIQLLIDNMKAITERAYKPDDIATRFSLQHLVYLFSNNLFIFLKKPHTTLLSYMMAQVSFVFLNLIILLSIMYSLVLKNKLLKLSLLTLVLLFFPVPSYLYCGLYIFPIIIIYFATHDKYSAKCNVIIIFFIIIILNPVQIGKMFASAMGDHLIGINYILVNVVLLIVWQMLLIHASRQLVRESRENESIALFLKKMKIFLTILFFIVFFSVLLFLIPQVHLLLLKIVKNFISQEENVYQRWQFLGSRAIAIIGMAMMIEIVVNILFLRKQKIIKNN